MTEIAELGYVTVGVSDLGAMKAFATQIIGAQIGEESDDELLIRNDVCAYRVRAVRSDTNDVQAQGWCVANADALASFEKRLRAREVVFTRGSAEEARIRRVTGFITVIDPDGLTVEVFHGLYIRPESPFHSPLPGGGFVTGDEGLGHVGLWVTDIERSLGFYRDIFGLHVCDRFDSPFMKGAFLSCNNRQHSLALVEKIGGQAPRALHHIEFETREMDDLGRAYDRAERRNILMSTLGKHSAEEALCFYMFTPFGFGWELSWGGVKAADRSRPETWHNEESLWGLRYLAPSDEQNFPG